MGFTHLWINMENHLHESHGALHILLFLLHPTERFRKALNELLDDMSLLGAVPQSGLAN